MSRRRNGTNQAMVQLGPGTSWERKSALERQLRWAQAKLLIQGSIAEAKEDFKYVSI